MAEWSPGYILPETLTGHAIKQVCFDIPDVEEYRQAFWGRVWNLGEEEIWSKDDPEDDKPRIAAEYWRQVLWETYQRYLASENCDADDCKSYSPGAPFIQWFPNDPYNTPDLVGEGYNNPAWYLATVASNLALGSSTGDVITSIDRFPPGSLPTIIPASGLPRFRVNVSGEGRITLHLVNLIAGSLIQLTKDDDPFTVKFIDVSRDLVSIPPETMDAFQVEVEFTTPGLHWIDCIVVSWVNASIPFLHHGGGLRQVDLCGFTDMPLVPPTMIRADPSGCGNLEKSTDGGETWTDIDNTDFLRRDGVCAMTGGLEIYPTADEALLTLKGVGSPYQTAKILRVQDSAGVDKAWINPRGDGVFTGNGFFTPAITLVDGDLRLDNSRYLQIKGTTGAYVNILGIRPDNYAYLRGGSAGFRFTNALDYFTWQIDAAGNISIRNSDPAQSTSMLVRLKTGQSARPFVVDSDTGARLFAVEPTGEIATVREDANNSTVVDTLSIEHRPTGTPTAGMGTAIAIKGKSSTTALQNMARLYAAWETATHASRAAKVVLSAYDFSGEKVLIEGGVTGASTPKLGFLGATPQPRLAISGDTYGIPALTQVIEALELFGFVTDASAPGTVPWATLGDIPAPFELPAPLAVDGSWYGVEAGKNIAVALDETGYIIDQTELGTPAAFNAANLNLRCRAAAAANMIVHHWYNLAVEEMAFAGAMAVGDRWGLVRNYIDFPLTNQEDLYNEWAVHVFDEFMNGLDATDYEAHQADIINFIPDIQQAFYCGIGDDGILTAAGLLDIQTRLFYDNYSGSVPQDTGTWFYAFFQHLTAGEVSIAIAHALNSNYVADVDCEAMAACTADEPDWCKRYLFSVSAYAPPFEAIEGDHVFGGTLSGWKTDDNGDLRIEFPFPTIDVDLKYTVTIPTAAISVEFGSLDAGYSVNLDTAPGTYNETLTIPEANRADGWYFEAHCNPEVCSVKLKQVDRMTGTGTEPTEGNDCL